MANQGPDHRRTPPLHLDGRAMTGREGKSYLADPDLLDAVNVALACDMPLLLTGEPGCGKTDFAYAVASEIATREGRQREEVLCDCPIRSDSRARDLLYVYDAVRRFSDAQLRGREGVHVPSDHPARYIRLEALGRALKTEERSVVLVDEIDKAPRDLPNDLLRPLEDGWFDVAELPEDDKDPLPDSQLRFRMRRPPHLPRPLVIVTSNQEQQLPEPFLRRCVFHHIGFPDKDALRDILHAHFADEDFRTDDSRGAAVVTIGLSLRQERTGLRKKPGTAELLRWMQALREVSFMRYDVNARLRAFVAALGTGGPLPWRDLPALGCLVKLAEDLERLGALPRGSVQRR